MKWVAPMPGAFSTRAKACSRDSRLAQAEPTVICRNLAMHENGDFTQPKCSDAQFGEPSILKAASGKCDG